MKFALPFLPLLFGHVINVSSDSEMTVIPLQNVDIVDVAVTGERSFEVAHYVNGDKIFVECYVSDFTYAEDNYGSLPNDGEGHLRLYVDDEHVATLFTGAFIIKQLPKGEHELKIVVAHNDHSSYGLEKTIAVTIGSS